MSQPTPYTPNADFSQQEANNASGRSTVNTAAIDAEFAAIETTLDQTLANIQLLQRDDGQLKDTIVSVMALDQSVINLMGGWTLKGAWLTVTNYAVNDIVSSGEYTYVCVTAHQSGVEFDSQYWSRFGFAGSADAAIAAGQASASAAAAATSATTATTKAASATASATAAATSSGNASAHASTATTKAGEAAASATNAANSAAKLPNLTAAGANKVVISNDLGLAWEYKTYQDLVDEVDISARGAEQIGYLPAGTGAVATDVQSKLRERVSVKDFGAIGDWNGTTGADDTAALRLAIQSGHSLDWGGVGDVYRVNGMISEAIAHAINWVSHGARIVQTSSTSVEATLSLSVGALNHRIDGQLEIDANMKSFVGFRIQKLTAGTIYPTDYANFYADGLVVKNLYRASTAIAVSAEGIAIRGPFDSVVLESPVVRNSVLASGAGVAGDYGCYGITFTENSYGQPQSVQVLNPLIDTVYCEDNTHFFDQDGLRFVASANAINPTEPTLRIVGGTFRDCWGRGIKSQAENAVVDGTRFTRRAAGFSRGYGNQEIDFQEGGGKAVNIQCMYSGHVPSSVVNFSTTRQAGKVNVPFGSINGAEIIIGTGLTLGQVFTNTVWASVTSQTIRASNIEVRGLGALTYFAEFSGANSGAGFNLLLSDNIAAPTAEWVACTNGTATGNIVADRQINTGAAINFRRANYATWRPVVSARDCIGFNQATSADNDVSAQGVLERVSVLAGMGAAADGGTVRVYSYTLANNATQILPIGGGNSNQGLMLISTLGAQRSGLFSRDSTGVFALAAGADFIAGTTTEPATGSHRTWYSTGDAAHVIKNASGGTRVYTVVLIG